MRKYNIFQGNSQIENVVKKTLGYDLDLDCSYFTEDIYFSSFFYLTRRFGMPLEIDDYKKICIWDFKVKQYTIRVSLNSSWVTFIVFGDKKHEHMPLSWVKRRRIERDKEGELIDIHKSSDESTEDENKLLNNVFKEFCIIHNIDDTWTQEKFDKEKGLDWFKYVFNYNEKVLEFDFTAFVDKYGKEQNNSYTRHALKTLQQFINNMLTPIWIRDVPYNIKGQGGEEYQKYVDNIRIDFIQKQ